jgi:hypothetical protein
LTKMHGTAQRAQAPVADSRRTSAAARRPETHRTSTPSIHDETELGALLTQFKSARRRRDEARTGTPDWIAANDEIEALQRRIFDVAFDDGAAGARRERAAASTDPDTELEGPESPAVI